MTREERENAIRAQLVAIRMQVNAALALLGPPAEQPSSEPETLDTKANGRPLITRDRVIPVYGGNVTVSDTSANLEPQEKT